jgi:hypothetical protein
MDHREPESAAPRRFARLVPDQAVRKVAVPRLLRTLGAGLLGLLVLGYGVWHLGSRATSWVRHQDAYWVPFEEIALEPPPPAWYQGGAPAFLAHVREAAMVKSDRVPTLEGDPGRLTLVFQKSPWVRKVVQVRRAYPRRLVVKLEYRDPVAWSPEQPEWLIDRDGVVLPAKDVSRDALGGLIRLEHLGRPYEPRPGRAWQTYDEAGKRVREDPRAGAAGRLAEFLRSHGAARARNSPPEVIALLLTANENDLFVQFEKATRVQWGKPPGSESHDEPTADEKWANLREWFLKHPDGVEPPDYLALSRRRFVIQQAPQSSPKSPLSRTSGGSRDSVSR